MIDTFVNDAVARMEVVGAPHDVTHVMADAQCEISAAGGPNPMASIERYAFYDRAKRSYAVIQTGERRFYGCFILKKGVIAPEYVF